jgi:hypothetical protein
MQNKARSGAVTIFDVQGEILRQKTADAKQAINWPPAMNAIGDRGRTAGPMAVIQISSQPPRRVRSEDNASIKHPLSPDGGELAEITRYKVQRFSCVFSRISPSARIFDVDEFDYSEQLDLPSITHTDC